ncbi:MAG: hypothetical protein U5O39_11855 [Gammaproteobacteria bacterium]|nr:hypothetical protein [Gammaproteobacteria bacterium]
MSLLNGFLPAASSSFLILMAESVQGSFSTADGLLIDDSCVLDIFEKRAKPASRWSRAR